MVENAVESDETQRDEPYRQETSTNTENNGNNQEQDSLGFYLSELYKNLNIITSELEKEHGETISVPTQGVDDDLIKEFENKFSEWMGSFYNILIYLFCTTIAFLAAIINYDVRIIPLSMFAFFPFYLWFTFLYSIPEIKLNNEIVFSRKDLTVTKQIKLAKSLFNFFLRQMYENTKYGIVIMLGYTLFLLIIILNSYLL